MLPCQQMLKWKAFQVPLVLQPANDSIITSWWRKLRWNNACQPVTIVILPRQWRLSRKGHIIMIALYTYMTWIHRQPSDHTASLSCLIPLNMSVNLQHTTSLLITSHTLSLISVLSYPFITLVSWMHVQLLLIWGFSPMRGFSTSGFYSPWGFPLV